MKYSLVTLALSASASAAIIPQRDCTFTITASGGETGTVGQLGDGQNRIGGGLPPATYSITNGQITDASGRGCILTPPTTQFQCDVGATPTSGFSIGSNGAVSYDNSTTFYACPASDSEYNIYTVPVSGQSKCVEVSLTASGCYESGVSSSKVQSTSSAAPVKSSPVVETSSEVAPTATITKTAQESSPAQTVTETAPAQTVAETVTNTAPAQTVEQTVTDIKTSQAVAQTVTETVTAQAIAQTITETAMAQTVTHTDLEQTTCPAAQTVTESAQTVTKTEVAQTTCPAAQTVTESAPAVTVTSVVTAPAVKTSQASTPVATSQVSATEVASTQAPSETPASKVSSQAPTVKASSTVSSPASTGTSCPANLSGSYQYPHLIIPVSSSSPNTAYGTQYNGVVNSTTSTIFNFDIPTSYTGTCSLVFLFPTQSELETSSFTFSGNGEIDFSQLSTIATQSTTYATEGSVLTDFGVKTVTPGTETVVSSFACPAGKTVSYELTSVSGTALEFFEDYNPSPIGLYVTSC